MISSKLKISNFFDECLLIYSHQNINGKVKNFEMKHSRNKTDKNRKRSLFTSD